jgi:hypothetical protein
VCAAEGLVRLVNVRKQASIIELLDMLDESFLGMCQHRRTVARCKDAARDLHEKATPGVMVVNEDWAKKFVISPARMLQSQYWAQISSSIFVSVLAWLDSARWHDRHVLAKGSWVTTVDGKSVGGSRAERRGRHRQVGAQANQGKAL